MPLKVIKETPKVIYLRTYYDIIHFLSIVNSYDSDLSDFGYDDNGLISRGAKLLKMINLVRIRTGDQGQANLLHQILDTACCFV